LFARMATYAFAVLAWSTIALAALAPPLIGLMLHDTYRAATPLVPLLAFGLALQSLAWSPMTSVNVSKRTRIYPLVTAIGAAVSVAANLLLIPPFGMRGAAYALIISQLLATAATVNFAQRAYHIPYEALRLGKVVAVGALTYGLTAAATVSSPSATLALRAFALAVFPVGLAVVRFFQPHEWTQMRAAISRITIARAAPAAASGTAVQTHE